MTEPCKVEIVSTERGLNPRSQLIANCRCYCGTLFTKPAFMIRSGQVKSCGCLKRAGNHRTHGMKRTPEYRAWVSMKNRCGNPKSPGYRNYGGRGICVSSEWAASFEAFIADMGRCPDGLTLERIDCNGGYNKENCKWATWDEQHSNKRGSVFVAYKGKKVWLRGLARELGLSYRSLRYRTSECGMTVEAAIEQLKESP